MTTIYDTDVSFNQPLTNVKDILLVNPTDTILDVSCIRMDISGQLVTTNMSCSGITKFNTLNITQTNNASSIKINTPLVPLYSYNINSGTNVVGSIGYMYSSMITFTSNLTLNTETDITGNLNTMITNIVGGMYMLKLDISYNNSPSNLPSNIQLKVVHRFNGYNMLSNVTYFKNTTDIHTYSNTCIVNFSTNETLFHGVRVPRNISSAGALYTNISTTIQNKQYKLSLLKIG
jgi:hypothetical protein